MCLIGVIAPNEKIFLKNGKPLLYLLDNLTKDHDKACIIVGYPKLEPKKNYQKFIENYQLYDIVKSYEIFDLCSVIFELSEDERSWVLLNNPR